jgi:hypothetical protein
MSLVQSRYRTISTLPLHQIKNIPRDKLKRTKNTKTPKTTNEKRTPNTYTKANLEIVHQRSQNEREMNQTYYLKSRDTWIRSRPLSKAPKRSPSSDILLVPTDIWFHHLLIMGTRMVIVSLKKSISRGKLNFITNCSTFIVLP